MRKFPNVFRVARRRYSEFNVVHVLEVGGIPKIPIEGVYEKVWQAKSWNDPSHHDGRMCTLFESF